MAKRRPILGQESVATLDGLDVTAWLAIASGADRDHGGNDGYEDQPELFYSWDTSVPQYDKVNAGDVLVLRSRRALLGASVIEEITTGEDEKAQYKCPECRKGRGVGQPRKRLSPAYLCGECGAQFDTPHKQTSMIKTYRSRHDVAWVDLAGLIDVKDLRQMCVEPKSQHSIRPLRWRQFREAVGDAVGSLPLTPVAHRAEVLAGGHRQSSMRVRVGQAAFRERLLSTFGSVCAFSGPAPPAAIEACHLYSYAKLGQHHAKGGLLLRRDLHRLFDLGSLAVHPESLTINVAEDLRGFPVYGALHGARLTVDVSPALVRWLQMHWDEHRR